MKLCPRDGCPYPKRSGGHLCVWHWLDGQPPEVQIAAAKERRDRQERWHADNFGEGEMPTRARVPAKEWPPGERWCAPCQRFVPLFYCRGSQCKAHASLKAHDARVEREYGITGAEYDALMKLQGGVCFVCQQPPKSKRLAVDHDHATGIVRGLLCAGEWGCNFSVLGGLEKRAKDGGLAAAKRLVAYLEHTPYERLREVKTHDDPLRQAAPF